jgi:hypothetical protein
MNTVGSPDGAAGPLREALMICQAAEMSGVLRVTGDPGGAVYLAGGLVTAVETPGAPGPEVLLLRSRRVSEAGWAEAFGAAVAAGRPVRAELIARQLVGAGELEALLRIALADAMFALASGTVEEYRAGPGPVGPGSASRVLPLEPGLEAPWLLAEATRRIRVLASMPGGDDRHRMTAVLNARTGRADQDDILALADGRRTARDIAFALGRGAYSTRLQLARMYQTGLVATGTIRAQPQADTKPSRVLSGRERLVMAMLPRRSRDPAPSARRHGVSARAAEPRPALGLLRPRAARDPDPGSAS